MTTRRKFLLGAAALPWSTISYAEDGAVYNFLSGFQADGKFYAGFMVKLDPGWKTYWRVPGSGGIAPDITVTGDNLKSYKILLPLPKRLAVNGEEVIGYQKDAVFVIEIEPNDPSKIPELQAKAFLGVCKDICRPVSAEASLDVSQTPDGGNAEAMMLSISKDRLPLESKVIQTAMLDTKDKPTLVLELLHKVNDIFVECKPTTYVKKPVFSADGLTARLPLAGDQSILDLLGAEIRVTIDDGSSGLEQTIRVT